MRLWRIHSSSKKSCPPHPKSRCERHGSWIKIRLEGELRANDTVVVSIENLDQILCCVVACKSHTPLQLVLRKNPRLPHDVLSDEAKDTVGLRTLEEDPRLQDAASRDMRDGCLSQDSFPATGSDTQGFLLSRTESLGV